YHVSDSIKLDIAITTINKLITHHKDDLHESAFVHSDQGFHYTSPKFQKLLISLELLYVLWLLLPFGGTGWLF
ncbi:ISCpe6, transposase OrfB, partial [human gut metagenome]